MLQKLDKSGIKWCISSYFSLPAIFQLVQSGIFAPISAHRGGSTTLVLIWHDDNSTTSYPPSPWLFPIWGSGCQSPQEWMSHCWFICFQTKCTPELNSVFHKSSQITNLNLSSQITNFSQQCDVWKVKAKVLLLRVRLRPDFPKIYDNNYVIDYAVTMISPAYLLSCETNQLLLNILRSTPVRSILEQFCFAK